MRAIDARPAAARAPSARATGAPPRARPRQLRPGFAAEVAARPDPSAAGSELARVLKWTLGIPVGAMVSVALLYVLGLLWKYGEIQDAGLVPTDVLSLVPHSQILGRGAQLLILALLALPLPLAFTWLLHRVLPERGKRGWGMPSALARVINDHERLRRDLDELRGDYDPVIAPGLDKRVRRLSTRANHQRVTHRRNAVLSRMMVVIAFALGLLVLSPSRAVVALLGLYLVRRTKLHTLKIVGIVFGVLVLAVAAERYTAPDPLPDATVRTTRGVLVKGPLVAATDTQWHLIVGDKRVKSVPTANIAKSSVWSESRLVRGPLGARMIDLFR
ncbi:MAG TPA: hypothetical protein VF587_04840 [Solirubrobacteraceae bacterium]